MPLRDRERWDRKHRQSPIVGPPSTSVTGLAHLLPASGPALDLAGGRGRHALWLAGRGLDVTLCDISEVALDIARQEASKRGVQIATRQHDVEAQGMPAGPERGWALVLIVDFLHRPLLGQLRDHLQPGGALMMVHPTETNLSRHPKPSERFVLRDGELRELAQRAQLRIVHWDEQWQACERHEARLVAQRDRAVRRE